MPIYGWILILVVVALGFAAGGFFTARYLFKRELKKNPPINEKMIRVMYKQMGRTPSEAQIRQVIRAMEQANR